MKWLLTIPAGLALGVASIVGEFWYSNWRAERRKLKAIREQRCGAYTTDLGNAAFPADMVGTEWL